MRVQPVDGGADEQSRDTVALTVVAVVERLARAFRPRGAKLGERRANEQLDGTCRRIRSSRSFSFSFS
jgi:hypothetical protein